jgi:hypothetical protein
MTFDSSPSSVASTEPSGKFLTHPATPSSNANVDSDALKNTPWTSPDIFSLTEILDVEGSPDGRNDEGGNLAHRYHASSASER